MAIYLIERHGLDLYYDQNHAHVIEARDESRVRSIAAEAADGEDRESWQDARRSTVTLIGASINDAPERIILTHDVRG